jgi:hypothetical protein
VLAQYTEVHAKQSGINGDTTRVIEGGSPFAGGLADISLAPDNVSVCYINHMMQRTP